MTHDAASFRQEDLIAVYGPRKVCFHTANSGPVEPVDPHHVMSRGNEWGIRPESDWRPMFSSILNCALLKRSIHTGPRRDADDQRRVYLRVAANHVLNAIGNGQYTPRPEDHAFLEWLRSKGYDTPVLPA